MPPKEFFLRRQYFVRFAAENNFDPLQAENWTTSTLKNMLQKQDGKEILKYYGNRLARALHALFPEVFFPVRKRSFKYAKGGEQS